MPASRFWPLQFIEGGCPLVLFVLLIAATVWLVRRRAALRTGVLDTRRQSVRG